MGKETNKWGMFKDYLKGIIVGVAGLIAVIVAFSIWVDWAPISIVLLVIGCPALVTGIGLIIHAKKENTHVVPDKTSDSSNSSGGRRYRHPAPPASSSDLRVKESDILSRVNGVSSGPVSIDRFDIKDLGCNCFNFDVTLKLASWASANEDVDADMQDVLDKIKNRLGDLNIDADIKLHF